MIENYTKNYMSFQHYFPRTTNMELYDLVKTNIIGLSVHDMIIIVRFQNMYYIMVICKHATLHAEL